MKRAIAARVVAMLLFVPCAAYGAGAGLAGLPGIWQMRGYGRILDVSPERVAYYDVTDVSCIRTEEQPIAQAVQEYDRIEAGTDRFTTFETGGITRYELRRLPALPERCAPAAPRHVRDPELNFWVLWHAFRENYAFFDLRQTNWDDTYARFRPRVTATTTDDELFAVMSEMLTPLHDGHVSLEAGERSFSSFSSGGRELEQLWMDASGAPDWKRAEPGYLDAVRRHVSGEVLKGKAKQGADGILSWGWAAPGIGYLNVASMSIPDKGEEETPLAQQLTLVDAAMTRVLADLGRARVLLVDARFNNGGYDAVALRIMGYFTREPRLAFTKKALDGRGYTEAQEIRFFPAGERQFTGPIVYMQTSSTVSAAEIFTLAMMARPGVTRVGRTTYGVLSDELGKRLPNGWQVSLSNEVYVAADGNLYEARGIPPDVTVDAGPDKDFEGQLRRDFEAALVAARK